METPKSGKPTRRLRIWLIITMLLLALAGWGWLCLPRRMQLVGRYAAVNDWMMSMGSNAIVETSDLGFLLHDEDGAFSLRTWKTGEERWRVLPLPAEWGTVFRHWSTAGNGHFDGQSTYALSRNGRYFATAVHQQGRMRIQLWCDGKLTGNLLLPAEYCVGALDADYPLSISDQGRLFVLYAANRSGRILSSLHDSVLVLEGGRIIARGSCPFTGGCIYADHALAVSYGADNGTYAMTIKQGRLHFTALFHTAKTLHPLDDGTLLDDDGKVYTATGTRAAAKEWTATENLYLVHHAWVIQEHTKATAECRVFQPTTGDAWIFTNPDITKANAALPQRVAGNFPASYFECTDVTPDGRYALTATEVMQPFPPRWKPYYQRYPWLQRINPQGPGLYYRIYERPGTLRAGLVIPVPYHSLQRIGINRGPYLRIYLSPDGHSVLSGPAEENGKLYYTLYRW